MTAFRLCELGANLPLLAVLRRSIPGPKPKCTTDRYQSGGGLTPIRIRTCDTWSHRRNPLNKRRLWHMFTNRSGVLYGQKMATPALMRMGLA